MRFERLHIPAFGPFTQLGMRFPAGSCDFHVIHGPNEAGKSSLLRAIRDLLFGIHVQSPENFLHDFKQLRIGGEIVNQAGKRLVFQRRKGAKNTLLDDDGHPLPDQVLAPFLGSVDQAYFSTMFGLGTRELREGAELLLRGEGELGAALFSASLGGTPVQRVLAALTEESERYFRGQAKVGVSIRPAALRYKDLLKQSRETAVSPEAWHKMELELAAAEGEKARLEADLQRIDTQLQWLARCEDALSTVGRLKEEERKLREIPPLPHVSGDFVEQARAARKAFGDADSEVRRLTAQVAKLEAHWAACAISPVLLNAGEGLERLYKGLAVYGDRKKSLVDLETELAGLEAAMHSGMRNLGLSGDMAELEALRLDSGVRLSCEEAAEKLEKASEERERLDEKLEDARRQIEIRERQLQALPELDLNPLREALARAAEATDAARTLPAAESEVKRLSEEVKELHEGLPGAPGSLDGAAGLPIPGRAVMRRFRTDMGDIQRELKAEEARKGETKKRADSIRAELARLERRGELPTEEGLREAREYRDRGWSLVLADWKGGGADEELAPGTPLEEAFPRAMLRADELADRLRQEAEAVAQAEEKRFQIGECEKELREIEGTILRLQQDMQKSRKSWEDAWKLSSIPPGSPEEMEEWRETWHDFKGRLRQLRDAEAAVRGKTVQVREAVGRLAEVLGEPGEKGFQVLFEKARRKVQEGEEQTGRRREIQGQLRSLKRDLAAHQQSLARAETAAGAALKQWKSLCLTVGLPEDVSPRSGLKLLQERAELLARLDGWSKASGKRSRLLEWVREYEEEVRARAQALGIDGDTTEARVLRLWKALGRARTEETRRTQIREQIEETERELADRQEVCSRAAQSLEALMREAGVQAAEALEPLMADLDLREQLLKNIADLRDLLAGLARGGTVDDFISRVEAEEAESLPHRQEVLRNRKQELEGELQGGRERLIELKGRRRAMEEAGDAAADFRQQAELMSARLKEDASRYVRLRLAVHFLQAQIEEFRKKNQGPLLEKSGEVFQRITRGAFSGLAPEFRADDTPVLVGVRPDGSTVPVSGMSDGTRDQLYLALRLAALDRYLDQHEPMPLILDDLLITFDDDRAAAILPQLAELARRTQILLFTHHDHLVDLCRGSLGEGLFHLHHLPILAPEIKRY